MAFTYKGLSAQLDRHLITDSEVEQHLQRLLRQSPRIAVVTDRPTQAGDEIVLDYAGFCDGEQFAGGTSQKQTLVLGSGMFIPGFEEQLIDRVVGESVTVEVTFPTEYHAQELAGKAAQFHCTIHEIRVNTPYELDDTFAKEVGQCENMTQLRQKLKESLQAYSDERGEMDLQDRLLRQAADTLEITFTEAEIEAAVEQQMKDLEAQLAQQGLDLQMYCTFLNTTPETIRADARPSAEAALRGSAAVEQILRIEQLEPTQQEIADALAIIARRNGITVEQLKEHYDAAFEAMVIRSILTGKVMSLIREHATVTVVDK